MKKIILLLVLLVSAIAVNAATYRVKYDVQNQRSTNFTASVGYDRLTINQTGYSLRRMGTITSSGITFDSYAYGSGSNGMFCVSTTSISIKKDWLTTLSGYVIMIDNKAYLADKIN